MEDRFRATSPQSVGPADLLQQASALLFCRTSQGGKPSNTRPFGPCSPLARQNPLSNVAEVWRAKKTERVIPNNAVVVAAFERFRDLLTKDEMAIFERFRAHATAFELSSGERLDGAPKFPVDFDALLEPSVD